MEVTTDITLEVEKTQPRVTEGNTGLIMDTRITVGMMDTGTMETTDLITANTADMFDGVMTKNLDSLNSGRKTRPGETNHTTLLMEVTMDLTTQVTRRDGTDPLDTDLTVHPIMEMVITTSTGPILAMDLITASIPMILMEANTGIRETT